MEIGAYMQALKVGQTAVVTGKVPVPAESRGIFRIDLNVVYGYVGGEE